MPTPRDVLSLIDYRRQVATLYEHVRTRGVQAPTTWLYWLTVRDRLYTTHPQSPVAEAERENFQGLANFAHDPELFTTAELVAAGDRPTFDIAHSSDGTTTATRVGTLRFDLLGQDHELSAYWLEQYGGGLFVPFRDQTSGDETYGGGRYLLDTAKSADLGARDGRLVLDFNYSYHPSCVHDPRWSCPLAPPENVLAVPVRGGERLAPES